MLENQWLREEYDPVNRINNNNNYNYNYNNNNNNNNNNNKQTQSRKVDRSVRSARAASNARPRLILGVLTPAVAEAGLRLKALPKPILKLHLKLHHRAISETRLKSPKLAATTYRVVLKMMSTRMTMMTTTTIPLLIFPILTLK